MAEAVEAEAEEACLTDEWAVDAGCHLRETFNGKTIAWTRRWR